MGAATLLLIYFVGQHAFAGFLTMFLVLFVTTGLGNGSTFRMIPVIFRNERLKDVEGKGAEARESRVEGGAHRGGHGARVRLGGGRVRRIPHSEGVRDVDQGDRLRPRRARGVRGVLRVVHGAHVALLHAAKSGVRGVVAGRGPRVTRGADVTEGHKLAPSAPADLQDLGSRRGVCSFFDHAPFGCLDLDLRARGGRRHRLGVMRSRRRRVEGSPSQDAGGSRPGGARRRARGRVVDPHRSTRRSAVACGAEPRPDGSPGPHGCGFFLGPQTTFFDGGCARDEDCTTGSNGRCDCTSITPVNAATDLCTYDQCTSDSDCVAVCVCRDAPLPGANLTATAHDPPNVCLGGNCKIDSDCGGGGYCSPSPALGCGATYWYGYYCHSAADQCTNDSDCTDGNAYCAYSTEVGHWICSTGLCIDD